MANMNRRTNSKSLRAGIRFDNEILNIQRLRIKNGVASPRNKQTNSTPRITNLIARHKLWPQIKNDIIKINFKDLEENLI